VTTPKVKTEHKGDSRFYVDPLAGTTYPGVTSVLNTIPKPFLKPWAAKLVAEEAVAQNAAVTALIAAGASAAAVDMLKRAPDRATQAAADMGTAAHGYFEDMARGAAIGDLDIAPSHAGVEPFLLHFEDFLDRVQPEFHDLEETVWSDRHRYAGSFDWTATIEGECVWGDNKTTRSGIHAETGLQLAAYRNAEERIAPDGTRTPNTKGDSAAVLLVRPEGWKLVPVRADDEVFDIFVHLRRVFDYMGTVQHTIVGDPIAYGPDAAILDVGYRRRKPSTPARTAA
jgi:hypothetical protein